MSSNQMSMKDYTVKKVIGEGAYGRAILCKENKSEDLVVIKEIAMANLSPQEQRDARKETKILACLHHPNIIGYRGSFTSNNTLHIVMDYADNGDLFTAIQNAKGVHFKEDQILDWFVQITLALKHIHDRKILHRDIKCQNIFLMKNGMIKMGDFGIAKILDHTTQFSKTAIGTPYYLSPEICEGKAYNAKSDIWSLGCVLYELCTLNHAFDSNCMNGLIMKILRAKHAPIPYYYSPQLRNLVDSLLNKNAQRRPSANQILKLDFIRARIGNLLSETIMKIEFSHTVFHKCKGGVTPKIDVKELPAISEEPKPKVNNVNPKVLQKPEAKQVISRNAQPRNSNNAKPVSKPPVSQAKPPAKQAPPPPKRDAPKVKVDIPKPVAKPIRNAAVSKVPSKEDLIHQKNQMVIAERNQQKMLKEQRDAEAKRQEEIEKQKRREVEKKAEERKKQREAEFARLKAEDKARKEKFSKLEAPFKKMQEEAMAAPPKPRNKPPSRGAAPARNSKPSKPSEQSSDESGSRDPSPKGAPRISHAIPRSDSGDEPKNVTARPGKVKRREDEVRDIREMIKRRRAELRAQAKAEKEGFIKIGGVEIPADIPKEQPKPAPAPAPEKKPEAQPPKQEAQRVVEKKPEPVKQEPPAPEPKKQEVPDKPKKSVEELINMSSSDDEDNEENDLLELAAIAKSIFDNPPDDDEGEDENEEGQPTPQPENPPGKFIFNGKELVLKHVSGDDSLSYRVEALRQFIEEGLSLDTFLAMYQLLTEDSDHMSNEEIDKQIHSLLKTPEQLAYYPLLNQLIACEDSLNHQESPP